MVDLPRRRTREEVDAIKQAIRALHAKRLYDGEISQKLKEQGISLGRRRIADYRNEMGLPIHDKLAETKKRIRELHGEGLNDGEISRKLLEEGITMFPRGVNDHRLRLRLPSNYKARRHREYMELYRQGLTDIQISERLSIDGFSVAPKTVANWRLGRSLPVNRDRTKIDELHGMMRKPEVIDLG